MTSVGAESFGISWRFGNLCGAKQHVEAYFQILKSWNIYTSLFDLNQISYFVIIELLCFFMCLTEKMNFLNNHIYTWHLVPIAVFDVLFALDLHKGLSLFLWSSSFIPQNALPVMVGTKRIDLLASLFWLSFTPPSPVEMFIHFCNRKLKWFTTLKPWQFRFFLWFPILWNVHPIFFKKNDISGIFKKLRKIHEWFMNVTQFKKQNPSRYTPGISFSLQPTDLGLGGPAHSASSGGATSWTRNGGPTV